MALRVSADAAEPTIPSEIVPEDADAHAFATVGVEVAGHACSMSVGEDPFRVRSIILALHKLHVQQQEQIRALLDFCEAMPSSGPPPPPWMGGALRSVTRTPPVSLIQARSKAPKSATVDGFWRRQEAVDDQATISPPQSREGIREESTQDRTREHSLPGQKIFETSPVKVKPIKNFEDAVVAPGDFSEPGEHMATNASIVVFEPHFGRSKSFHSVHSHSSVRTRLRRKRTRSGNSEKSNAFSANEVGEEKSVITASFHQACLEGITRTSDLGEPITELPPIKDGCYPFVCAACYIAIHWPYFDYIIGIVILLNSISIGYELAEEVQNNVVGWMTPLEYIFLSVYWMELIMRFFSDGKANWQKPWVCFDIFLVGLGTSSLLIIQPIVDYVSRSQTNASNEAIAVLQSVMIFRIMRLLRLLRALRLLSQFKILWRLVQGLLSSLGTMLSTLALLTFTIYVFGCIGLEVITKDGSLEHHEDETIVAIRDYYFASLPDVMLTLTQFVTLDSISAIYGPLINDKWWRVFYFLPIILILPIALMNLVTAVLVEAAMAMGKDDADMEMAYRRKELKRLEPEIRLAFRSIDQDDSGILDKHEVAAAAVNLPEQLQDKIKAREVMAFFDTLDVDGSGELDEEEFVEGVLNYIMSDIPIQTQQTLKLLRLILMRIDEAFPFERASQVSLPRLVRTNASVSDVVESKAPRCMHL